MPVPLMYGPPPTVLNVNYFNAPVASRLRVYGLKSAQSARSEWFLPD